MRLRIGLTGLALLLLGAGVARADPVQIRVAWVAPIANWISIWLDKKDLAKHFGQSYVFAPVHFAGTPPMVTAIANNEVEIGDLAYSTLPIAIKNAGMDDIRVIADDFQDGVDDYWTIRYDVLKDGPIKKVEDLKGKVLATNAEGSAVDIAMKAMLHQHGLENKRDYTVIEAPNYSAYRTRCLPPRTRSANRNLSVSRRASHL
jgi:sulfonate transport system substrate-binding protein